MGRRIYVDASRPDRRSWWEQIPDPAGFDMIDPVEAEGELLKAELARQELHSRCIALLTKVKEHCIEAQARRRGRRFQWDRYEQALCILRETRRRVSQAAGQLRGHKLRAVVREILMHRDLALQELYEGGSIADIRHSLRESVKTALKDLARSALACALGDSANSARLEHMADLLFNLAEQPSIWKMDIKNYDSPQAVVLLLFGGVEIEAENRDE